MSSDIIISIFGKVTNPEGIKSLAEAMESEATIDWTEPAYEDEILDLLKQAQSKKKPLVLTRKESNIHFDEVTAACQEAGLSYVMHSGPTGEDFYTDGVSWRQGDEEEHHFEVTDEEPSMKLAEIRAVLADGGLPALETHLENLSTRTKPGRIEIEAGFEEAYEALIAREEAHGM